MKYLAMLVFVALISTSAWGQQLLIENFNYADGDSLNGMGGWTAHSAAGANPIYVTTTAGLTYSGFASSGIGGGATLKTSGEDLHLNFPSPQSSGTLYAALLVNITSATTTGDYFFHYYVNATTIFGRLFAKRDASNNLSFGISKSSGTISYTSFSYSLNTTYLIVIKYQFNPGKDYTFLFVDPALGSPEPTPTLTASDSATSSDPSSGIFGIALRQGTASSSPAVLIDGIRVATGWNDVPLPVTMKGITAKVEAGKVCLNIATASEVDVIGFNISRALSKNGPFDLVSSYTSNSSLRTSGSATSGGSYAFVDTKIEGGKTYYYEVEAVSKSGGSKPVGDIIQVNVVVPNEYTVYQNYPKGYVAKEEELEA